MRIVITAALALGAIGGLGLAPSAVQAREYPWCAQFGALQSKTRLAMLGGQRDDSGAGQGGLVRLAHDGGGRNCGFDTLEQCRAAINGIGGYCEQNLFYRPEPAARPVPRDRRR